MLSYTAPMLQVLLMAATIAYAHPEQLVDTAWVAAHSNDRQVRVLDVRRSGFDAGHIPNAVWLDPESIRDPNNPPTYMLAAERFADAMGKLGISNSTRVILYDDRGGLLAARLWWMLNAYGHSNVALVNGGWVQWTAEKRPTTAALAAPAPATFTTKVHREWLATLDDVQSGIGKAGTRILDARTVEEMNGTDTRLSTRGGVIPSSIPVYWEDVLDPTTKQFKNAEELQAIYEGAGIRRSDAVIAYCWVGHRSAVDLFALHLIGYDHLRNYLGSWEEWSKRMDLPIEPFRK